MNEDSIVQEVRVARENYARLHGFDVRKIVADLQKLLSRSADIRVDLFQHWGSPITKMEMDD
jgi:hypothetical protein